MKKLTFSLILILIAIVLVPPYFLGFSVWHLGHAVKVSTSLSAKLGCSARYITGLTPEQIVRDLSSYSPVAHLVDMQYTDNPKGVNTTLFGLAESRATFREGIGCTLDFDSPSQLNSLSVNTATNSINYWPIQPSSSSTQKLVDSLVSTDNINGQNTRALLVLQNGQLMAESYGEGFDASSRLLGWSMGKSLTAMMLGRMQQLGYLNLDSTNLLSDWQNTEKANLTLKQLLQMSSGLDFDETYAPGSDATHMLFTAANASEVALASELVHSPGSHFSYSSGTTNLLQRIIHQKLGRQTQNTLDFLTNEIFRPLGIQSAVFEPDSEGILVGSSYVYATGRDWAKLGWLMANNGEFNNRQLLPQTWVEQSYQPNTSSNEKAYGFQFWLNQGDEELRWPSLPNDAYAMMGNRKQSVMIIPSMKTVLVRLGWSKGEYPMEQNYLAILETLNSLPTGAP